MPKKEPLVVADPDAAFKKFEDLTRQLLAVSRDELQQKLRQYEAKKARQRTNKKRRVLQSGPRP